MTTHIGERLLQVTATEDLSQAAMRYKCVSFAGTIAPDGKRAVGVLKFGATSGSIASVILDGITKGDCSTAVSTAGWALKVVTSGWLAAAASGDQVIARYIGQAATASGDRIPIILDALGLAVWQG